MNFSIAFFPLLPTSWFAALVFAAVVICVLAYQKRARDFVFRAGFLLCLAVLLLHPVMTEEMREKQPDIPLIVVDETASQRIGGRDRITADAVKAVQEKIKTAFGEDVSPVVVRVETATQGGRGESTNIFTTLREHLVTVPLAQAGGTIIVTDGQVHDVPEHPGALERLAPFHVVLTGRKDEFDRKVTIVSAPKYGVLNDTVTMRVRLDVAGTDTAEDLILTAAQDNQPVESVTIAAGETREFSFKLNHPGQNVFEFSVPAATGELTAHNNTAPVIVNAVRDRMRVLLVSGSPHMGLRSWRNLLKSDPSIDLIHFTILRSPLSMDFTPQEELSLIVFPVEELFEHKIQDFDLIIFDRYYQYSLLMPEYFDNISRFVRNGGALLMAMNTDTFDTEVYDTAVGDLLPVVPVDYAGDILRKDYRPALTAQGRKHPVTSDLLRHARHGKWGMFNADMPLKRMRGDVLMTGADGNPLLVIDTVEKGRVAVLSSDNIWTWSRSGRQSGPYVELLRNLSHWLLKEPELEDGYIKAETRGRNIIVSQRDMRDDAASAVPVVTMTQPSGAESDVRLDQSADGRVFATVTADETGVYRFTHGEKRAFAVVGAASNVEFSDVITTPHKLQPVVDATRGTVIWYQDTPDFSLRQMDAGARSFGGRNWIGIKSNNAYTVTASESRDLIPAPIQILFLLLACCYMWRREGGKK